MTERHRIGRKYAYNAIHVAIENGLMNSPDATSARPKCEELDSGIRSSEFRQPTDSLEFVRSFFFFVVESIVFSVILQ